MLLPGNKGHDLGMKGKKRTMFYFFSNCCSPLTLAAAAAASFRVGVIKQGKVLLLSLSVDAMSTGSCSLMFVWVSS